MHKINEGLKTLTQEFKESDKLLSKIKYNSKNIAYNLRMSFIAGELIGSLTGYIAGSDPVESAKLCALESSIVGASLMAFGKIINPLEISKLFIKKK